VDYEKRRRMLAGLDGRSADDLLAHRADGAVKMFVAHRALATRAALRDVYEQGDYVPLDTDGSNASCVFAFARAGAAAAITCVPRLVASLTPDAAPPLGPQIWSDTRVHLPPRVTGRTFRDAFTGATVETDGVNGPDGGRAIAAAALFAQFPVALLLPCSI
jgi:(1->4)-alpha-D-glucan 1-alpha-D-glucosylmutase